MQTRFLYTVSCMAGKIQVNTISPTLPWYGPILVLIQHVYMVLLRRNSFTYLHKNGHFLHGLWDRSGQLGISNNNSLSTEMWDHYVLYGVLLGVINVKRRKLVEIQYWISENWISPGNVKLAEYSIMGIGHPNIQWPISNIQLTSRSYCARPLQLPDRSENGRHISMANALQILQSCT